LKRSASQLLGWRRSEAFDFQLTELQLLFSPLCRHSAAERFIGSCWFEKTFDRSSCGLSNDVQVNQI